MELRVHGPNDQATIQTMQMECSVPSQWTLQCAAFSPHFLLDAGWAKERRQEVIDQQSTPFYHTYHNGSVGLLLFDFIYSVFLLEQIRRKNLYVMFFFHNKSAEDPPYKSAQHANKWPLLFYR
jgi:hypothetical protein